MNPLQELAILTLSGFVFVWVHGTVVILLFMWQFGRHPHNEELEEE